MKSDKNYLVIDQIVGTVGLKGEVRVNPMTDSPQDFDRFNRCFLELNGERLDLTISRVRYAREQVILAFDGYDTLEKVTPWKGSFLSIDQQDKEELEEGAHYIVDLLGCQVVLEDGTPVGTVSHVYQGAHDLMEVLLPDGQEVLIPMVDQFIKKVDTQNKKIVLTPIEGLLTP